MSLSRRKFLTASALALPGASWWSRNSQAAQAPEPAFEPNWESLRHYSAPQWYRDAKFGIWAHWSAQCVPEQGDWYARRMYLQGDPAHEYHTRTYGHPSTF